MPNEVRCRKKAEHKDEGITADLPGELKDSEHRQKEEFQCFDAQDSRRRAGITTFSKLLEIKGYEVFRVDTIVWLSPLKSSYRVLPQLRGTRSLPSPKAHYAYSRRVMRQQQVNLELSFVISVRTNG